MLSQCKNNAIHSRINDICIARPLSHHKNNSIHCEINGICIAWMVIHDKKKHDSL